MIKFFYLLLALPLAIFATSCDDDDKDVPNVDLEASFNAAEFDGEYYTVQGDVFTVESLKLINNSGKNGTLGATNYYLDGRFIGATIVSPYTCSIETSNLSVGRHVLGVSSDLFVVDYPTNIIAAQWVINIVESKDDIPAGAVFPVQPEEPGQSDTSAE